MCIKYPLFLSGFNKNLNFLDGVSKENIQISNLMKTRPVTAGLFCADGRTDLTKLIVAFRNFANALKTSHPIFRVFLEMVRFPEIVNLLL